MLRIKKLSNHGLLYGVKKSLTTEDAEMQLGLRVSRALSSGALRIRLDSDWDSAE
jgi:hypothetical protein